MAKNADMNCTMLAFPFCKSSLYARSASHRFSSSVAFECAFRVVCVTPFLPSACNLCASSQCGTAMAAVAEKERNCCVEVNSTRARAGGGKSRENGLIATAKPEPQGMNRDLNRPLWSRPN
jgi:hypothetical protein